MLDSKSLDTISRLKSALLIRAQKGSATDLPSGNRGKKIAPAGANINTLTPKIVEYNGSNHLVLTNDVIERTNYNNKRRWSDFYRNSAEKGSSSRSLVADEDSCFDSSDSEFSDDDDNPFKKIRLSEILAPLYHPSEIYTHPAISKTFKSGCLSTLAAELIEVIEGEQKTLNQFNRLLQVLDGEDWYYQLEENMELPQYDHGLDESEMRGSKEDGSENGKGENGKGNKEDGEIEKEDGNSENGNSDKENVNSEKLNGKSEMENGKKENGKNEETEGTGENGATIKKENEPESDRRITRNFRLQSEAIKVSDPFFALPKSLEIFERQQKKQMEETEDDDELVAIQQELINYLQVSIQRQHEYIKNLSSIRAGLVKADKYKKELYRWSREMGEKK